MKKAIVGFVAVGAAIGLFAAVKRMSEEMREHAQQMKAQCKEMAAHCKQMAAEGQEREPAGVV